MEIGERRQAGIVILQPVGRIDNVSSETFQARLFATVNGGGAGCIIDLSGVPYIASFGMRALIAAARAKPEDYPLVVAAPSKIVAEVFRVAHMAHVVPVYDTVAEAEAALIPPSPA